MLGPVGELDKALARSGSRGLVGRQPQALTCRLWRERPDLGAPEKLIPVWGAGVGSMES